MVQVDKLTRDKRQYMMQVGELFKKQYAYRLSSDFHAKFNGNTVRGSSDNLYHVAGGQVQDGQAGVQVQHGQAGVHDVCGGVV